MTGDGKTLRPPAAAYPTRPQDTFEPLITAAEAYPALERQVVAARQSIWLAYRVFEPWTPVLSREAQALATDWTGLLRAKLDQGVAVRLLLSDFDGVGGTYLHARCWQCLRALAPLWQAGDFAALPVQHMAGAGWFWRVALWPVAALRLAHLTRKLNRFEPEIRRERLAVMPGLWPGIRLDRTGRARLRWTRLPGLFPATYHQKFAVIDHDHAILGGLDMNRRRLDDPRHQRPACDTWADVAVEVDGLIATDLARHFAECWAREAPRQLRRADRMRAYAPRGLVLPPLPGPDHAPVLPSRRPDEDEQDAAQSLEASAASPVTIAHDPDDMPPPRQLAAEVNGSPTLSSVTRQRSDGGTLRLIRTATGLPGGRGLFRLAPRTMANEIEVAHLELIERAERLIYIETQFLRSRRLVEALVRAARDKPQLRLILTVPAAPMEIAFQGKHGIAERVGEYLQAHAARKLRRAFVTRMIILAPARPVPFRPMQDQANERAMTHGAEMIFLHSKVMTVDDSAAIVGSANLNGRSMHWDVEVAVLAEGGTGPARLRRRLFEHWLAGQAPEAAFGLDTAVAEWRRIMLEQIARPPGGRESFLSPYPLSRASRFGRSLPGVPEDFL